MATGIARDAGNNIFRYYLLGSADVTGWYPSAEEFAAMGCRIDVLTPNLTALFSAPEASQSVADRLARLQDQGVLQYETGRTTAA